MQVSFYLNSRLLFIHRTFPEQKVFFIVAIL